MKTKIFARLYIFNMFTMNCYLRQSRYRSAQFANSIVSKIRKAHRAFLKKQVQESIGDIKKHWKILKKTINKTNNKSDITTEFLYQGQWIKDDQSNVNNFNQYYAKIGIGIESVGRASFAPRHYLNKSNEQNVTAEDVQEACKKTQSKG